MVSRFLNAIIEALDSEFGSNYKIYTEDIRQGLEPPCFLVDLITWSREKLNIPTYKLSGTFAIQYFPSGDDERNEIHNVISRLDDCLEVITVTWQDGERPKTKRTRTQFDDTAITDGVLTYTIKIEDVYIREETGDPMESADITVMEAING